jgi:type III secretion system FlhB-like substrate exporter
MCSPENVEVIFIRYSVQKNCPRFLGYSDNMVEDKIFLQANKNSIPSPTLKSMVENLLKN